jgi:heat shock protein HslJ
VFAIFLAFGCVYTAQARGNAPMRLAGTEWILLEISSPDSVITLDRAKLRADGMGDVFTLKFEADRVSGKGAPNRYTASCQWRGKILRIGQAASTKMLAFREPEQLKEAQFFDYLSRVESWDLLPDNNLVLMLKDSGGAAVSLVFGKL